MSRIPREARLARRVLASCCAGALGLLGLQGARAQAPELDTNEAGDAFGSAVVTGDFNGDGFPDLVVAAPGEGIGPAADAVDSAGALAAGRLYVFWGSRSGLGGRQALDQGGVGTNEAGDRFASALAAGDFNGDGIDDLAIGAPGETLAGGPESSGIVYVFLGGAMGMTFLAGLEQESIPLEGGGMARSEVSDLFGSALAAGDFDGDGIDDLAVGAPGERIVPLLPSGGVFVFRGGRQNPLAGAQGITQGSPLGDEFSDAFGSVLAAADFDGDGRDELAVGIPRETIDIQPPPRGQSTPGPRAGVVALYRSAAGGPLALSRVLRQEDLSGQGGASGDLFGAALVAADFNGDGRADLAVGMPGKTLAGVIATGAVLLYQGSVEGLIAARVLDQARIGRNELQDRFGSALAAADFDGDERADLAIGAPGEGLEAGENVGVVYVFAGAVDGPVPAQGLDRGAFGIGAMDGFGFALAADDFDDDGRADLAIGIPNAVPSPGEPRAGAVAIFQGVAAGLRADRAIDEERAFSVGDAMPGAGVTPPPRDPVAPPPLTRG